jgi:8-amino-7-oxononanoate synthase
MPLILGSDGRAMAVAGRLQTPVSTFAASAPTVPEGTARLRIVITRNASVEQIDALAQSLKEALS